MIKVKKEGVVLRPTKAKFESRAVFNPGILQEEDKIHMIYRAVDEKYISSLGYASLNGPFNIIERWKEPFMAPRYSYEKKGIEDARITKIDDTLYMTYVVHDGVNVNTCYSFGKSIFNLKRGGIITPRITYNKASKLFEETRLKDDYYTFKSYYIDYVGKNVQVWDKDVFFFPEKINGKYALMHRILPDIQIAYAPKIYDFKIKEYWEENLKRLGETVALEPEHGWETRHLGGGAPPIKTRYGWLLLYHGVEPSNNGRIYHAGAALLSLRNPRKVLARLPEPLFSPTENYEKSGDVEDVVFPTGTAQFKDRLFIYYGTADSSIAVASVNLESLIKEIRKYKK